MLVSMTAIAQAEETETFTWWVARGEDTSYYDNYVQNPMVQYLLQGTFAGKKLDVQFWQGISGAEKDNFNNMLATGDMADVIDLSFSDYTPGTLYEDGYILDLTPYVEQYMPNYWKLLQENEKVSEYSWSFVDGERKILFLTDFSSTEPWEGYHRSVYQVLASHGDYTFSLRNRRRKPVRSMDWQCLFCPSCEPSFLFAAPAARFQDQ